MADGILAKGTLLKIGDGASPETFTAISEVNDIAGPALSQEFVDFTHQESPGATREFKPSFKISGDVTFGCHFLPDDETQGFDSSGLLKDYEDQTLRNFQLLFPDDGATLASFAAYVANIAPAAPLEGKMGLSVTLRISGVVTWS